jgi:hypothetical protein
LAILTAILAVACVDAIRTTEHDSANELERSPQKRNLKHAKQDMKTIDPIENTPGVAARRHLTARAAVPLLAFTVAAGALLAAIAFAQSAKEIRGATPYAAIENEPAPKLIADPPLPDLLAKGVVWIQDSDVRSDWHWISHALKKVTEGDCNENC